jgi:rubrerythrin
MGRKTTDKIVKKNAQNLGYYFTDDNYIYHDSKERVNLIDKNGYLYNIEISEINRCIKKGLTLARFHQKNIHSLYNIYLWVKINNKPYIIKDGKYINSLEKSFLLFCKKCSSEWNGSWKRMLQGDGCPYCGHIKVRQEDSIGETFPFLEKEWDYNKNLKSPFSYSSGSSYQAFWICSKCGNKWNSRISSRAKLLSGCPNCFSKSKGENIIKIFLESNNVLFCFQKRFNTCRGIKNPLPFDFCVYDYLENIFCLIEYQGEQHTQTRSFFGGIDKLIELRNNDSIKRDWCNKNGIKLLEIQYVDFENINNILESELSPLFERR